MRQEPIDTALSAFCPCSFGDTSQSTPTQDAEVAHFIGAPLPLPFRIGLENHCTPLPRDVFRSVSEAALGDLPSSTMTSIAASNVISSVIALATAASYGNKGKG